MKSEEYTAVLNQAFGGKACVKSVRPLTGGMVNCVELWETDGAPSHLVVKRSDRPDDGGLRREYETLRWYREHTRFPVPEPYACITDAFEGTASCLMMEYIDAPNLGSAHMSRAGRQYFQEDLARQVLELHGHRNDTYGSALEAGGVQSFNDMFRPALQRELDAVDRYLSTTERRTAHTVLECLDELLPDCAEPRLTHGDLWATNIIVDDSNPDRARVRAFIDCGAAYRDVEAELAYLMIFHTADEHFFRAYAQEIPLRHGFDLRCRIYWLNTWMLHVRMFGEQYLSPTRRTLAELQTAIST